MRRGQAGTRETEKKTEKLRQLLRAMCSASGHSSLSSAAASSASSSTCLASTRPSFVRESHHVIDETTDAWKGTDYESTTAFLQILAHMADASHDVFSSFAQLVNTTVICGTYLTKEPLFSVAQQQALPCSTIECHLTPYIDACTSDCVFHRNWVHHHRARIQWI